MKNVFSLETERDKDLMAVADAVAWCRYKLDRKACKAWQCPHCSTMREIDACLKELPACDSLKVKQMGLEKYFELSILYGRPRRKAKHVAMEGARLAGTFLFTLGWTVLAGGGLILLIMAGILMTCGSF